MSSCLRRILPGLITLMALATRAQGDEAAQTAPKPPADDQRVIQLFNGKSLEGWITESGEPVTRGWEVKDGQLTRTGRGGAIYFDREFEDFVLDFEWKIAPGVNSGIKYRVRYYDVGVRGNPGWLGCEYQIYDDARNPGPLYSTGALYDLYPPNDKKKVNPPGEYNRSRIVVAGTRIEHWLNGERIVEADTASDEWQERVAKSKFAPAKDFAQNRRGHIQVQDHGGQVWFRSITLRPLEPAPSEEHVHADPRLLGKWQSDAAKTMEFNEKHVKLEDRQIRNLRQIFGKMTVAYRDNEVVTTTPAYSITTDAKTIEMEASELTGTYSVLGTADDAVAIKFRFPNPVGDEFEAIQVLHFEGDHMWTYVGDSPLGWLHIREYFKRVDE